MVNLLKNIREKRGLSVYAMAKSIREMNGDTEFTTHEGGKRKYRIYKGRQTGEIIQYEKAKSPSTLSVREYHKILKLSDEEIADLILGRVK